VLLALLGCRPTAPAPSARREPDAAAVPIITASTPPGPDALPEPELEVEEREENPTSERVKIKLVVFPVDATVFWGVKNLGVAGKTPLELERPRGSGPLDLVARAPGYVPYHTRVLTDRDEKLTLRLVRNEDAGGLLGFRRTSARPPSR
jgi:hypothetical protein